MMMAFVSVADSVVSPTAQSARPNIPALTGLRFFAAFFILFAHAVDWLAQFQDSQIRTNFTFVSAYGMPLFFVLSGFVIHYNYGHMFKSRSAARAIAEFAAARLARLFPLYICFLLVAVAADNFVARASHDALLGAEILIRFVTLTQSWFYQVYDGISLTNWVFALSWSISTEMFFYFAYSIAVYAILRIEGGERTFVVTLLYAFVATVGFLWSRYALGSILDLAKAHIANYVDINVSFADSFYRWLFYFSPYSRIFEFFMGCLTAHLFINVRNRPVKLGEERIGAAALAGALGVLVLDGLLYQGWVGGEVINSYVRHLALNFLCAPAIAVVMFCVCRYKTKFSLFLSLPTIVLLGETSYSIYLVHSWTLQIFKHPVTNLTWVTGLETMFRIIVAIALTLMVAFATYRLIEVPGRVWLRMHLGQAIAVGFGEGVGRNADGTISPRIRFSQRRVSGIYAAAIVSTIFVLLLIQTVGTDGLRYEVRRFWAGYGPEIAVLSATYGMNCRLFQVPSPFANMVEVGNQTKTLRRVCNARERCDFLVDAAVIGDPANSCGKDFTVDYKCTGSDEVKSAFLAPEAHGKRVMLDCSQIK